ncbi:MAG: hypothetical protein A2Z66_09835 [Chloroflexi bacterium RBG_13_66_10]|nr:MAG: hypothetical protein A2Z66_09835 [Chloroflexi bacterium RBG_13_66_10]
MDLPDGRRGKRLWVKLSEDLVRGSANFIAVDLTDPIEEATGGAESWSLECSATYSAGSRSERVLIACPSLMNVAPSSPSAIRRCSACE